jgi:tRNA/tmRNA/rRNA uracil-C5-methylase (TrmA/RlmC/RlmD family)
MASPVPGSSLTLDVEKPAAGGRMLARHQGQVVLVWGGIPGERVAAIVERTGKGVIYAETTDVLRASPDRRPAASDWRCGGNVFAHVGYPRQLQLKGEIVQDAFGRIARHPLSSAPGVVGSPEHGYRMRARLHAQDGTLGFYREGTHQLCDAQATGQLLPATSAWIASACETLRRERLTTLAAVELAENIPGDERACHLELHAGADPTPFRALAESLAGLSAQRADRAEVVRLAGTTTITDVVRLGDDPGAPALRLRRDVRAFFQGNRFLLERLVRHVLTVVPGGAVVDLYAGVGLFGLSLATAGVEPVTLVEGDPVGAGDLQRNADAFGHRVKVERRSVEAFLSGASAPGATFVVDPPRTGLSKEALTGMIRHRPATIVYVSCDVATLARDTRALLDAGYQLGGLTAFDLFPNTAHVETVATFAL